MRTLTLLLCFLIFGSHQASAISIFRAKTSEVGKTAVEVSVTDTGDADETKTAIQWAVRDLDNALATNPELKPEIYVAEPDQANQPTLLPLPVSELRKTHLGWARDWLQKNYRVSFTVIRLLANTGVTTWGLMLSPHVSMLTAIPVGLIAGGMSASFQYFNEGYQAWMLKSKGVAGQMGKTFGVNAIYMAMTKFTSLITGIMPEHTFADASTSILKTALLCTLAQGPWSLGVAQFSRTNIAKHPEREDSIRLASSFKTLALSMAATALSVANLMGVPMAEAAMIGMAGSGAVYYTASIIKARKWASKQIKSAVQLKQCENQLTP